ncbi:helix-turn-helix domain-containing protein [Vreelandella rituensis]|uniref:Uncharacterized protein n=1 Tax=Vreelandella rituensis TaxID=2282306 RepID=A0A368TQU4_9GAMM|nr:helix-turn-helix domain-containing protein [Halomonas rituensis]RCV86597.1 hypothetical protein DU506_18130 [Halomonas rituensis]
MPNLSRDAKRKYAIIHALEVLDKPNLQDIVEETAIPAGTVKRQLTSIREEFRLHILFIRDASSPEGANGYYSLESWGILDREAFLSHFGSSKVDD